MTNAQLADLLEEAARRLRAAEGIEPIAAGKPLGKRETPAQFGKRIGKSDDTVQAMCSKGLLVARQIGRGWQIDAEASERDLAKRR